MSIKLIVVDLDGTLLADQFTIHPANIEVVKQLTKNGYHVIIATGRPFGASQQFYRELELTTPIINYNGAVIHVPDNPKFESKMMTLPLPLIYEIEEKFKDLLSNMMCEFEENGYMHRPSKYLEDYFWNKDKPMHNGKMIDILTEEPLFCVIEVVDEASKKILFDHMKNHEDYLLRFWDDGRSMHGEITKRGINKGSAIEYVAKLFDCTLDNVLAIGDAGNDLEMIKTAKVGVAMINGDESLKQVANHITSLSNYDGGAGAFLKEFFKI